MVANFSLRVTIVVLDEIQTLITMSVHNKDHEALVGYEQTVADPKNQQAVSETVEVINKLENSFASFVEFFESGHVENAIYRLQSWAKQDEKRWSELFTRLCAVRDAIRIEFKDYQFYAYPSDKGRKFKAWANDWHKIIDAFPAVRSDSFAATDCYALTHNTASVFHSMRVAEVGFRAVAKERRIKLPRDKSIEWACWQEILKALDDEIKVIGQTWKAGKAKDAALEFYSGARADLNGFKDEYRNLVMHLRVEYDEFQALRALSRVHDFMSRLATKMNHQHHRIRWGR